MESLTMKVKIILAVSLAVLTLNASATIVSEEDCRSFNSQVKTPTVITSYRTSTGLSSEWKRGVCELTSTHEINFQKQAEYYAAKDNKSIKEAEKYIKSTPFRNHVQVGLKYNGFMEFREYTNLNIYIVYNYDEYLGRQKFTMSIGGDPVVSPMKIMKSLLFLDMIAK